MVSAIAGPQALSAQTAQQPMSGAVDVDAKDGASFFQSLRKGQDLPKQVLELSSFMMRFPARAILNLRMVCPGLAEGLLTGYDIVVSLSLTASIQYILSATLLK